MSDKTMRIRELNDAFREDPNRFGGNIVMTRGLLALGTLFADQAFNAVRAFTAFTEDSDPHGKHDFGSFEFGGHTLCWKIDYYDASMAFGSEDPSDPTKTTRVLTLMLADEY